MKRHALNTDNLISEYRAGKTCNQIGREFGVSGYVVSSTLKRAGVDVVRYRNGGGSKPRVKVPIERVIKLYGAGVSENAISKQLGIDRNVIRNRLIKAGVKIRNQSEAERVKWTKMTKAKRAAQVSAAHAATRGKPIDFETKIKHALTVETRQLHVSDAERELWQMLVERGIAPIIQKAIGPYNCDLGAYPVAVEIFGGNWHWSGRHMLRTPERFRYILDAGWHVLVIRVDQRAPLGPITADYVAAFIQQASSNPSARREYRVIRCTGETIAAGSSDDDQITIVPALRSGRDASGRYTGIPR